jgi:hypothetical protein
MYRKNTNSKGKKQGQTPIYCGSRVVGYVKAGVFYKSVSGSKHFKTIPPGIAFDISTLKDAEKVGAVRVEVYDRETQTTYKASIARIWERGKKFNQNYGEQIELRFVDWVKHTKGAPVQPSLFEAK